MAVSYVERANVRRGFVGRARKWAAKPRGDKDENAHFTRVFSAFSLSRQRNRQLRRLSNTESNTWFIQRIVDKIIP